MLDTLVSYTGEYRRRVLWDPPEPEKEPDKVLIEAKASPKPPPIPRKGNGHKSVKVRSLLGGEKNMLRAMFTQVDGVAKDDYWVSVHKDMDSVLGIFQVTGFVSYLHREVAMGKTTLVNMPRYIDHIKGRRNLWASYNSPKYKAMRVAIGLEPPDPKTSVGTGQPAPKFAAGFPSRKIRRWSS